MCDVKRGSFDHFMVKELRDRQVIATKHVKSSHNPADLLTKCHSSGKFHMLMHLIRNVDVNVHANVVRFNKYVLVATY